jgi:hypothetical protein
LKDVAAVQKDGVDLFQLTTAGFREEEVNACDGQSEISASCKVRGSALTWKGETDVDGSVDDVVSVFEGS